MAADVQSFAVAIAPGGSASVPQLLSLAMPPREVVGVRIRVPPGCGGHVGWALSVAGTPIMPSNAGGYMVQDNEVTEWPLENQPDSGAWQLAAYNTGKLTHTVYVTFLLALIGRGSSVLAGPAAPLVITPG